jgi:hypothetical protein
LADPVVIGLVKLIGDAAMEPMRDITKMCRLALRFQTSQLEFFTGKDCNVWSSVDSLSLFVADLTNFGTSFQVVAARAAAIRVHTTDEEAALIAKQAGMEALKLHTFLHDYLRKGWQSVESQFVLNRCRRDLKQFNKLIGRRVHNLLSHVETLIINAADVESAAEFTDSVVDSCHTKGIYKSRRGTKRSADSEEKPEDAGSERPMQRRRC